MNNVTLIGRLTRDPEVRYSQGENSKAIARYSLAVDRYGEGVDFINITAFGKNGEFAEKYLRKGMKIAIQGRIQTGSYTNREGRNINTFDVIAERHEFCESRNTEPRTEPRPDATDEFMQIPDGIDEELPFA